MPVLVENKPANEYVDLEFMLFFLFFYQIGLIHSLEFMFDLRQLTPEQRKILNDWYEDHQHRPYPSPEEKVES